MANRKFLLALETILVEHVENDLKFQRLPLPGNDASALEIREAFPFGRLHRWNGGELEIIEIQVDKRRKEKFVINCGIAPAGGVDLPWGGDLEQDEAPVSALPEAYRLYKNRIFQAWFSAGHVPLARDLLTELEIWFSTRLVGKHMGYFGLSA